MAVAKALGARRVIAVDIQQERLDFAKSYAATDIYLPVSPLSTATENLWKDKVDRRSGPEAKTRMQTTTVPKSPLSYALSSISPPWDRGPSTSRSKLQALHHVSRSVSTS